LTGAKGNRLPPAHSIKVSPSSESIVILRYAALIRKQSCTTLAEWLARGETSSDPDLRRFAEGIRRDEASVYAAVMERWSNGPVEGHVNRRKVIHSYCLHCHRPPLGFEPDSRLLTTLVRAA
jgi:hypothetical protein